MPVIVIHKFNINRLSIPAQRIMKTAVRHAEQNRQATSHTMSIIDFCNLACITIPTRFDFLKALKEACKATATIESIDPLLLERDDLPFSSWSIFERVAVENDSFSFKISRKTFDRSLLNHLNELSL
jgi:hypothetical protein